MNEHMHIRIYVCMYACVLGKLYVLVVVVVVVIVTSLEPGHREYPYTDTNCSYLCK